MRLDYAVVSLKDHNWDTYPLDSFDENRQHTQKTTTNFELNAVFHLQNKTTRKLATTTQCDWPTQQSNFIMNEENEFYYDSDEDFYEDFDEDELYDPEDYYLSVAKIDNLIHTIRMYGSKYHYLEIEKLILETDEELVF